MQTRPERLLLHRSVRARHLTLQVSVLVPLATQPLNRIEFQRACEYALLVNAFTAVRRDRRQGQIQLVRATTRHTALPAHLKYLSHFALFPKHGCDGIFCPLTRQRCEASPTQGALVLKMEVGRTGVRLAGCKTECQPESKRHYNTLGHAVYLGYLQAPWVGTAPEPVCGRAGVHKAVSQLSCRNCRRSNTELQN